MPPLTEGILFRSPLVLSYQLFLGSHLLHTNTTIISLNPTFFHPLHNHILLLLWSKDSLPTAAASPLLMLQLFGPCHTDQLFLWQGLHSAFTSVPVTQILSSVFLSRPPSHDTNLLILSHFVGAVFTIGICKILILLSFWTTTDKFCCDKKEIWSHGNRSGRMFLITEPILSLFLQEEKWSHFMQISSE